MVVRITFTSEHNYNTSGFKFKCITFGCEHKYNILLLLCECKYNYNTSGGEEWKYNCYTLVVSTTILLLGVIIFLLVVSTGTNILLLVTSTTKLLLSLSLTFNIYALQHHERYL